MSRTKLKIELPQLGSFAEMEAAFGELAAAQLRIEALNLELEAQIGQVRSDFLLAHGEEIELKTGVVGLVTVQLHAWATQHEAEQFAKKRSLETKFGTLKFFKGQHKAEAKLKGGWDAVMERLRAYGLAKRFIRQVDEPKKDELIDARDEVIRSDAGEFTIGELGVRISQEETFTIEIKREPVAPTAEMAGAK